MPSPAWRGVARRPGCGGDPFRIQPGWVARFSHETDSPVLSKTRNFFSCSPPHPPLRRHPLQAGEGKSCPILALPNPYFLLYPYRREKTKFVAGKRKKFQKTASRFSFLEAAANHSSSSGTSGSKGGSSSAVWPFLAAHSSLVMRMDRGLEPWKGPTMPFSSISSTIRAARA